MTTSTADLRALVADTVRDVVTEMVRAGSVPALTRPSRAEVVRIADDHDLDRFVRAMATLFENDEARRDVQEGRLRFRLSAAAETPDAAPSPGAEPPVVRVDAGAVTERQVIAAGRTGHRIVLGPRAVLTPLGREKARALGVPIEKEQ